MFLCGWSRRILPSRHRNSILHGSSEATSPSNCTRRTDMHQHEAALEYSQGKKLNKKKFKMCQLGASYSRYIKSNLYSPSPMYGTFSNEHFQDFSPRPLFATLVPTQQQLQRIPFVPNKFGNVPKGFLLSYQQRLEQALETGGNNKILYVMANFFK